MVGVEWNGLAGLMNIPYSEREEIRINYAKYPDSRQYPKKFFHFLMTGKISVVMHLKNGSELNLHDVNKEMLNVDEVCLSIYLVSCLSCTCCCCMLCDALQAQDGASGRYRLHVFYKIY